MPLLKSPLLKDPLFFSVILLYLLNRFVLKDALPENWVFFDYYLNDVLLIPCALPPVLAIQYILKLRPSLDKPDLSEVMLHLCIWGIIAEIIGPMMMGLGTSDSTDLICYAGGAMLSVWFWQSQPRRCMTASG